MSMLTFTLRFIEADLCLQIFNAVFLGSTYKGKAASDLCINVLFSRVQPPASASLLFHDTCLSCGLGVLRDSRCKPFCAHTLLCEPSLEQVLREALRQYEKQARIFVAARQSRPEHNRHVSAQVTKMVIEKRKEWSKLTSLNDLTLAVCSILYDDDSSHFKRHFLQFAVEGREHEPSIASTETSEDSEDTD